MINTWFTSDHHFGHKNILAFEKDARKFSCVEDMNETMVKHWNEVVKPKDIVFHLGDFAFGKANLVYAGRLNGHKKLIMGNHDCYSSQDYLQYFEKLYGMIHWKDCVLSHMPIHMNEHGSRWFLNVHGHLHSKLVKSPVFEKFKIDTDQGIMEFNKAGYEEVDRNYFNVSVEQNNFYPFHADEILARAKEVRDR